MVAARNGVGSSAARGRVGRRDRQDPRHRRQAVRDLAGGESAGIDRIVATVAEERGESATGDPAAASSAASSSASIGSASRAYAAGSCGRAIEPWASKSGGVGSWPSSASMSSHLFACRVESSEPAIPCTPHRASEQRLAAWAALKPGRTPHV